MSLKIGLISREVIAGQRFFSHVYFVGLLYNAQMMGNMYMLISIGYIGSINMHLVYTYMCS